MCLYDMRIGNTPEKKYTRNPRTGIAQNLLRFSLINGVEILKYGVEIFKYDALDRIICTSQFVNKYFFKRKGQNVKYDRSA